MLRVRATALTLGAKLPNQATGPQVLKEKYFCALCLLKKVHCVCRQSHMVMAFTSCFMKTPEVFGFSPGFSVLLRRPQSEVLSVVAVPEEGGCRVSRWLGRLHQWVCPTCHQRRLFGRPAPPSSGGAHGTSLFPSLPPFTGGASHVHVRLVQPFSY